MRRYHFFYVWTDVKWKTCSSSYFSLLTAVIYPRTVCLHETNFPCEEGHSIAHSILKTCAQRRKGHFGLFLDTNTGVHLPRFLYSPNYVLKLFNLFRRNALENQFKQRKNSSKGCINSILLKFFNATLRRVLMNVK